MAVELYHLSGTTIAVFGLARSGLATVRAALAGGATRVVAWDDNNDARASAAALGAQILPIDKWPLTAIKSLILSPGVPLTHPQPHPVVDLASDAGIEIISDIELLYRELAGKYIFVGITGTNGKSTTTALLSHVLNYCDVPTLAAGNIGLAALDLELPANLKVIVLELSSYQLDLTTRFLPDISVWTNLSADHLDRHGSMAGYQRAKERIFANQSSQNLAVVGVDEPEMRQVWHELCDRSDRPEVIRVSVVGEDAELCVVAEGRLQGFDDPDAGGCDLKDYPALRGQHNFQNALCAFAVGKRLGCSFKNMDAAMRLFGGLQHRMEIVGHLGPVVFVNDSKATNADAAARALATFSDIFWIAGGRAKEDGINPLKPYFDRIRFAVLFGESAQDFARQLGPDVPHMMVDDLEAAVPLAFRHASASDGPEPVMLFSPAAASFDQFPNFEVRGEKFSELVTLLEGFSATIPS
jgi:UDP-N-acetylmuramoylalanine--D-glutamate ligase